MAHAIERYVGRAAFGIRTTTINTNTIGQQTAATRLHRIAIDLQKELRASTVREGVTRGK